MNTSKRPALGGSFVLKALGGVARLVAYLAVFVVATNLMDRDQYGEAQQILSLVALIAAIADFGISGSLRRFLGELETDRPAQTRPFLVRTAGVALAISAAAAVVLVVLRQPFAGWIEAPQLPALAYLAGPLLVLTVLNMQLGATFDGLERFDVQAWISVLYALALGGAAFVGLWLEPVAGRLVAAYVIATTTSGIIALGTVVWVTRGRRRERGFELPSSLRYGGWVFLATVNGLAIHRINVLFVGGYHDGSEVALYSVADRFFQIPIMGLFLFVGVMAPRATRLFTAGDHGGLQRLYQVCNGLAGVCFGGAIVGMFVLMPWIVVWMFPKYPDAVPLIRVLLPVAILRIFGSLAGGGLLIAAGRAREAAVISITATVLTVIGDAVLVPSMGSWGAVWVTVVIQSIASIALVVMAMRLLKLRFRVSFRGARDVLGV